MLPYPLENETSSSYCSRLARLNHGKGYVRANVYRTMKAEPARPVFGGFGQLNRFLLSHDIELETYSRTSMLPFFKPFTAPALYTVIQEHALTHAESVGHLMPRTFLRCIAESPKICLSCVESDVDRLGFSYLRRQHQIICNLVCERHSEKLLSRCPSCEAPIVHEGIPLLRCVSCGASPRSATLTEFESSEQLTALTRIAQAVTDIFAGRIVGNINLPSYLMSAEAPVSQQAVMSARLAENCLRRYGPRYLLEQQMHPTRKPHFGWPAVYVSGGGGGSHPVMELLLHGADPATRSSDELWGEVAGSYQRQGSHSNSAIDLSVLKAVFRYMTVMEAVIVCDVQYTTLADFVRTYPLLSEKLDRMRARRLTRKHRDSVLAFLEEKPSATLMDLKSGVLSAYRYLRRNDMDWWRRTTSKGYEARQGAQ